MQTYRLNPITIKDEFGDPITVAVADYSPSIVLTTQYGRERRTTFVLSRKASKRLRRALKEAEEV